MAIPSLRYLAFKTYTDEQWRDDVASMSEIEDKFDLYGAVLPEVEGFLKLDLTIYLEIEKNATQLLIQNPNLIEIESVRKFCRIHRDLFCYGRFHPKVIDYISQSSKETFQINAKLIEPDTTYPSIRHIDISEGGNERKEVTYYTTPKDLQAISRSMPNIQTLIINSGDLSIESMKAIGKMTTITTLRLSDFYDLTDDGMQETKSLKGLTDLDISSNSMLTSKTFSLLTGFQNLTSLNLESTFDMVSDPVQFDKITFLTNLTWLNLRSTHVTDAHLRSVSKLTELVYLNITFGEYSDAGVKEICEKLQKLSELVMYGNYGNTAVTTASFATLGSLPRLRSLSITRVKETTLVHIEQLFSKFNTLRELNIGIANLDPLEKEAFQERHPKVVLHNSES